MTYHRTTGLRLGRRLVIVVSIRLTVALLGVVWAADLASGTARDTSAFGPHGDQIVDVAAGGPADRAGPRRLDQEYDNLRVALRWAVEWRSITIGDGLTVTLSHYWLSRGRLAEGRQWLERMLAREDGVSSILRAVCLCFAGLLARRRGELTRALRLLAAADRQPGLARQLTVDVRTDGKPPSRQRGPPWARRSSTGFG